MRFLRPSAGWAALCVGALLACSPDRIGGPAAPEAAVNEDATARALPRRNFPRAAEGAGETSADARIDDVIASLSQALGSQAAAPEAEDPAAMPDVERPVTRLRRLGA